MRMPYLHEKVTEDHEVHGVTIQNVVWGQTLLLPIHGFGRLTIPDKHFCQVVNPYIGSMAKIWNLFVEVNNTSDPAEKERKATEAYEAFWQLILKISKSDLATKNVPEDLLRDHFFECLRESQKFCQDQAASNQRFRASKMIERDENFKGERMGAYLE